MPLSVVIPCYNAEAFIGEQLEALARQDWDEPWEVVISDNGSTDGSLAVVERFRGRVPSLRVVDSSRSRGSAHARNIGIEYAAGDVILHCDADDVVADNFVSAMAKALETHDFVACRLDEHRLNEPWVAASWGNSQRDGLPETAGFLPSAGAGTLGFKRFVFETVGGFDPTLRAREDTDFCWKAQLQGIPLHFVPETAVHYRFPVTYGHMYRQSSALAEFQVVLYRRYRPLGMTKVPFRKVVRGKTTWRRLLRQLPELRRADRIRRARFVREVGDKVGRLKGRLLHRAPAP